MIRLAYNTNGFACHALDDAVRILADLGYEGIALTPDVHHLNPFTTSAWRVTSFRSLLERLGLDVAVETGARFLLDPAHKHSPSLMSPGSFGRRQDFLRRCIDLAGELGAPLVSIWSGALPQPASKTAQPEKSTPEERGDSGILARNAALLAKRIAPLLEYAAAKEVRLALEPEPGMFIDDMALFDLLDAALPGAPSPRLWLTLDVGHAEITEEMPPHEVLASRGSRIINVHLDDVSRGRHEHLPPGEGEIDFVAVMKALVSLSPPPFVSLELSRHSHDAVEQARRSRAFVLKALRGALGG